jgi:hypothetical protein
MKDTPASTKLENKPTPLWIAVLAVAIIRDIRGALIRR